METQTPLTPHVGVEIDGISSDDLVSASGAEQCKALLQQYGVVVYRNVDVDDDQLIEFSSMIGELVVAPTNEHERPEIQTITSHPKQASPMMASIRRGNFLWHFDGATDVTPQQGTFLAAREVSGGGEGGTQFASSYVAYDTLPDDDKALIADLRVEHSFAAAQTRVNPDPTPEDLAFWARVPARVHPLVWSRRDGRKSMLLGATADHVAGWPADESSALLDRLLEWATRPEFVAQHDWRLGDLVTWDNTGMLHRAMPFEATTPRLLHRTTLKGVEVVA
jgi:alpha-ketoglutarate-dependent taurine dioxygenase